MATPRVDLDGAAVFNFKARTGVSFELTLTYPLGTDLSGVWQMVMAQDADFKRIKLVFNMGSEIIVSTTAQGEQLKIIATTQKNTLAKGTYYFGIRRDVGAFSEPEYIGRAQINPFFTKQ